MSDTWSAGVPIAGAMRLLSIESSSVAEPGLIRTLDSERPAGPVHHVSSSVPSRVWYCGNGTLGFGSAVAARVALVLELRGVQPRFVRGARLAQLDRDVHAGLAAAHRLHQPRLELGHALEHARDARGVLRQQRERLPVGDAARRRTAARCPRRTASACRSGRCPCRGVDTSCGSLSTIVRLVTWRFCMIVIRSGAAVVEVVGHVGRAPCRSCTIVGRCGLIFLR